jgi:hypothetical protein
MYILVDKTQLGSGLTLTRKQRDAVEKAIPKEKRIAAGTRTGTGGGTGLGVGAGAGGYQHQHPILRRTVNRKLTYFGMALLCGMVVTAWVIFFLGLAE